MEKSEINRMCLAEKQRLIQVYYGNLAHEAAVEMPETIGKYTLAYAQNVANEYKSFLKTLWDTIKSPNDDRTFEAIMNNPRLLELRTADDLEAIGYALKDAERRTLWERLTVSNHKDVTFYKGLLLVYTEELLECMRIDFVEELE